MAQGGEGGRGRRRARREPGGTGAAGQARRREGGAEPSRVPEGASAGGAAPGAQASGVDSIDDMTPEQRVGALATMAHAGDVRVRKSVAVALGRIDTPAATGPLCDMLGDPDEGVRVLACQALGRRRDPASVQSLLCRMHDPSVQVRSGVLFALGSISAGAGLGRDRLAAMFAPIVVMAFDPDDGVRADAAAVLGTLLDSRATEPLLLLVEDDDPRVRGNACASLGLTGADDDPETADRVAQALAGRVCDDAEAPLVRVSALDGLARRSERGWLDGREGLVREAVYVACALAGAPVPAQADDPDGDAADHEPTECDLRQTAVWALGMLPCEAGDDALRDEAFATLEHALADPDPWCQRYAVEALCRRGEARGIAALGALRERRDSGDAQLDREASRLLDAALGQEGCDASPRPGPGAAGEG
ncbi:MAG: HEAT repeat domain-containing protein [Coriobacteriales bacterium]|jgi:HEAT repeat protein